MALFPVIAIICANQQDFHFIKRPLSKAKPGCYHMITNLESAKTHKYFTDYVVTANGKGISGFDSVLREIKGKIISTE